MSVLVELARPAAADPTASQIAPEPQVRYQPGVDVRGRPVAPAELSGQGGGWLAPDRLTFSVRPPGGPVPLVEIDLSAPTGRPTSGCAATAGAARGGIASPCGCP